MEGNLNRIWSEADPTRSTIGRDFYRSLYIYIDRRMVMKNRPGYTKGGDTLEEGIDGSFSTPSDPWILNSNRCCRGNLRSKGANLPFDTLSTLPIHKGNLSLSLSFSSLFLLSFLFSNSRDTRAGSHTETGRGEKGNWKVESSISVNAVFQPRDPWYFYPLCGEKFKPRDKSNGACREINPSPLSASIT